MRLRAHHNVIDMAEARREREQRAAARVQFVDWCPAPPPSHPAAQALLAGLLQGLGERDKDEAMADAGRRLAEAAQKGQPAAPGRRWRANTIWTSLGLSKDKRPS
jgi:hypothetical protein